MTYDERCALYRKEAQVWYEALHGHHAWHIYEYLVEIRRTIPANPWN